MQTPIPVQTDVRQVMGSHLQDYFDKIKTHTDKDVLTIIGSIDITLAIRIRIAIEANIDPENRKDTLLVILHTPGGSVTHVQTIVNTMRNFYENVHFLIPVYAMSAGTVLVMSGDAIFMDYFSCLGPIDPQILRNNRYVPALSYLRQVEYMQKKSREQGLTEADLLLLNKCDLAELDEIKLTAELSVFLISEWLPKYKFKDWQKDGKEVSMQQKKLRAKEIAEELNNQDKWYVHGFGIHKDVLEEDLKLKIDDYSSDADLKFLIWTYLWSALEYAQGNSFVHCGNNLQ